MTYTHEAPAATGRSRERYDEPRSDAWLGWIGFGGVMMVLVGTFQTIDGLTALFSDDFFLVTKSDLLVSVSFTTWGWVHLILGIVMVATGFGVVVGQLWARVVGILLAMVAAVVNLAFLAAYPVWSAVLITMDVIVIYALAVHGREARNVS